MLTSELIFAKKLPRTIGVDADVTLQLLTPDDAAPLSGIIEANSDIPKYVTWASQARSEAAVARYITEWESLRHFRLGIFVSGHVSGYLGMFNAGEPRDYGYGIGYFLSPKYRGRGIVPRSVKKTIDVVQTILPVKPFVLHIADENSSSRQVAKSLGFESTEKGYFDEDLQMHERQWEKGFNSVG